MTLAVKICGITNIEDALVAIDAGADLLGFILYPKSPRYVEPGQIAEIVAKVKEQRSKNDLAAGADLRSSSFTFPLFVGVFVNEPLAKVGEIMDLAELDYAQLHGDEGPEMLAALAGRAYKALRPASSEQALADAAHFTVHSRGEGPRLLVDAYDRRDYGGTGKVADWQVAAELAHRYPGFLLAGGLTPENVADAVRVVRPWAVDVSSGTEAAPGRKDHGKVRQFVTRAKQASRD